MKESVTYQAIIEKGKALGLAEGLKLGEPLFRLQEARSLLLKLGEKRLGPPDPATRLIIQSVVPSTGWNA